MYVCASVTWNDWSHSSGIRVCLLSISLALAATAHQWHDIRLSLCANTQSFHMTIQIFQTIQLIASTCVNCIQRHNVCAAVQSFVCVSYSHLLWHIPFFHNAISVKLVTLIEFQAFLQPFRMVNTAIYFLIHMQFRNIFLGNLIWHFFHKFIWTSILFDLNWLLNLWTKYISIHWANWVVQNIDCISVCCNMCMRVLSEQLELNSSEKCGQTWFI